MHRFLERAQLCLLALMLSAADVAHAQSYTVSNPLQISSIQDFIAQALKVMVYLALPVIGFFIVVAGFKFLTAQGNTENLKAARKNFLYVIIGAALILGAWQLANLIGGTVNQLAA